MDDLNEFEPRFEDRVRTFALTGIRPVDSAAVAHAVAVGRPRDQGTGSSVRWPGLTLDRRAWAIALAIGLALAMLGGAVLIGARLLLPPAPVHDRLAHLVYILDDGVYLADPDGSNPVRIADGGSSEEGLVSPDGRLIAYRSDESNGTVVVRDQQGRVVTSFPGGGWQIAWSPDSARVATWVGPGQSIGIYGLDGVRQAVLDGSRSCCGDYDPKWSPDGASLLIPAHEDAGGPGPNWEVPIDGGTPRPVPADDPRSHRTFAVSPDGGRAAFIAEEAVLPVTYQAWLDDQLVKYSLVVAAADGTDQRMLVEEAPGEDLERGWWIEPLWSPTGDRIAYVVRHDETLDGEGYVSELTSDLRVVDIRTGIVTTLGRVRGTRPLHAIGFSPTGDQILVGQTDIADNSSLWIFDADGSGARKLVAGTDVGGWLSMPSDSAGPATP